MNAETNGSIEYDNEQMQMNQELNEIEEFIIQ